MLDAAFGCRPCGFRYILKQRAVLVIRHPFRSLQKCAAKDSSSFCVELESSIFGESAFMVSGSCWQERHSQVTLSCSRASKCMKNLREKVLGTNVKEDSEPFLAAFGSFCLLKKVSQTKDANRCQGFILRLHDLAFLHFRRFGQVGYLVTVQTWQRTKSWRASCHFAIFPSLVNFDFCFILSLAHWLLCFILSLNHTWAPHFVFEPSFFNVF
jgi:hypothetical protein